MPLYLLAPLHNQKWKRLNLLMKDSDFILSKKQTSSHSYCLDFKLHFLMEFYCHEKKTQYLSNAFYHLCHVNHIYHIAL